MAEPPLFTASWDGDLEAQRLDADPETGDPPEREQGWQ
jgi:hypothetical protein